ncbi:hypothetical protein MVES1_003087 [Malassezia vespertilionis]|uniref:uncharacterized protein n=1 Tax=Malassezia vespertilionis TaxID=2020962 RepID=UPI0024B26674|nr:uncharacterized protein MVES1_003087 [Malassezia vespertilionis]WFD07717.1 hypothetical protein MVES1_003087 [Malassezia vespertilionis]
MPRPKRKAEWSQGAPEKRVHREDEDPDFAGEGVQVKAKQGQVITDGYDSEESDDAQPGTHRRGWGNAKEEDDDMFADNAESKQENGKEKKGYLKLSEIEGQEFGARTHVGDDDDDDDDDDEQDPEYELERATKDTRPQDANADAERTPPGSDDEGAHTSLNKQGMGFKIEKFNMKADLTAGQFDEEGNYVWNKKDPFAQSDRWLEGNYSKHQIRAAKEAHSARERMEEDRVRETEAVYPTMEHAAKELVELMEPGESVLDTLQRTGAAASRAKKQGGGAAEETFAQFTRLSSILMTSFSQANLYDEMYEGLVRIVRRAGLASDDWDPARSRRSAQESTAWEYKWTPAYVDAMDTKDSMQIFGPFSAEQMQAWSTEGYFGAENAHILVRNVGSDAWIQGSDATW